MKTLILLSLIIYLISPSGYALSKNPHKILTNAYVTLYGEPDNSPPGGDIAFPCIHQQAGGTGTFGDPITFAVAFGYLPKCQIIYYPTLQKYFIMEDECVGCGVDHIDLWAGYGTNPGIAQCEDKLTKNSDQIIISPPPNLPVDVTPIWDEETQTCVTPPILNPPPSLKCMQPINVSHQESDSSVTISWQAPLSSLPVTEYEIDNLRGQDLYKGSDFSFTTKYSGYFHVYLLYSNCADSQSKPVIVYFISKEKTGKGIND